MDEKLTETVCEFCGATSTDPKGDGWCLGEDGLVWCPACEQDHLDHLPADAEGAPIGAPVIEEQ